MSPFTDGRAARRALSAGPYFCWLPYAMPAIQLARPSSAVFLLAQSASLTPSGFCLVPIASTARVAFAAERSKLFLRRLQSAEMTNASASLELAAASFSAAGQVLACCPD